MKKLLLISLISFGGLGVTQADLADDVRKAMQALEKSSRLELFYRGLADPSEIRVVQDVVVKEDEISRTRHIILTVPKAKKVGAINLLKRDPKGAGNLLSLPRSVKEEKETEIAALPTALLIAGAEVGMHALDFVPETPGVSVVTMDYGLKKKARLSRLEEIIKNFWRIQAQYIVAYTWLYSQNDVNSFRLSSVNVSFGNFIAPYPLRVLNAVEMPPNATVFAFGGSKLMPFVEEGLKDKLEKDDLERVKQFVSPLLEAVDPTRHLEKLSGPFLLVKASDESIIPGKSFAALEQNLPEPKEVLVNDGAHINTDQKEVIAESVKAIFEWLQEQGQTSPL